MLPGRRDHPAVVRIDTGFIDQLKKRDEPSDESERTDPVDIDRIIIAGIDRGLTVDDMKEMELGQLVDFCIEYNKRHDYDQDPQTGEEKEKVTVRKATQADMDTMWG